MHCCLKISIVMLIVIGITNADDQAYPVHMNYNLIGECDENSVIQKLSIDDSFDFKFGCYFNKEFILDWSYNITIANQTKQLKIPNLTWTVGINNGNMLYKCSGIISEPEECAGDIYIDFGNFETGSPNDCATTGVSELKLVTQPTIISGKCQSQCMVNDGYIKLDPPIGNEGPVKV